MGVLHYRRHFILLACIVGVLVATGHWSRSNGAVASFGIYGALHSAAVAVTFRVAIPVWRKLLFVAVGGSLSMLCVTLAVYGSRRMVRLPGMGEPALVLAVSSAVGAASYAMLLRAHGATLTSTALGVITLACTAAPLGVLLSGIYLKGGAGLWFAGSWWFAFSCGLWRYDGRRGVTSAAAMSS